MFFDAISKFFGLIAIRPKGNGLAASRPANCRPNGFRSLVTVNHCRLVFVR